MNQKQKKLAEQAIRMRYANLIGAVKRAKAIEEERGRFRSISVHSLADGSYKQSLPKTLHAKAGKLATKCKTLAAQIDEINGVVAELENERHERGQANREIQHALIVKLEAERDESILKVHFDGTGEEMLKFLKSLPDANHVREMAGELNANLEIADVDTRLLTQH